MNGTSYSACRCNRLATYTKDWDFYAFKTHADITKHDGGKAQYDVYTEVIASGDVYLCCHILICDALYLGKVVFFAFRSVKS
jgi:hypothetical protein